MLIPSVCAVVVAVGVQASNKSKSVKSPAAIGTNPAATAPVEPSPQVPIQAAPQRRSVAVAPLASTTLTRGEADLLGEALSTALQKRSGVRMMERSQMDRILQEQGFQNSGACDKSDCAIQIGRILGIDQIVVGSVGKLGGSYLLNARLVDVGTGEILGSTSRTAPARIEKVIDELPKAADDLFGTGGIGVLSESVPPSKAPETVIGVIADQDVYDADVKVDDPFGGRLFLRANLTSGASFAPDFMYGLDYGFEAECRVAKKLWLRADLGGELWNPGLVLDSVTLRGGAGSYVDLPNATPGGDPSRFSWSVGATWMFSQKVETHPQSQVFDTRQLFSQTIGNTNFTAYHSKYVDVPVTTERSIGLRGGLLFESHSFFSRNGNGGYLLGEGSPAIVLLDGPETVNRADSTMGWTNEHNTIAYLGVSREYRQGSEVMVTRNQTGAQFLVRTYSHSVWYLDALLVLASELDDVEYQGRSYPIRHGDDPGQVPSRLFGFRGGFVTQGGSPVGLPFSGELGWIPGSGPLYFKLGLGLGLRV